MNRKTGQILLQQLFLCENRNELRLHSYMNATPYPVVYEMAIHIGRDKSFQRRTAVSSILCKHGARKWIWGHHVEEWEVMNRVGGGADFAFTPSWQLPIVVLESSIVMLEFTWSFEITPRDEIVLECRRREGAKFWVEVDSHYPAHGPRLSMVGKEFCVPIRTVAHTGLNTFLSYVPWFLDWGAQYCDCVMEEVD